MTRYEQVQQFLEQAVDGETIGRHGNFWRGKTRDQFVALQVFTLPIIDVGHGAASNLVKALRGEPPFDGSDFPRMPLGFDPVPVDRIQIIQQWIDDGCPETPVETDTDTYADTGNGAVTDPGPDAHTNLYTGKSDSPGTLTKNVPGKKE